MEQFTASSHIYEFCFRSKPSPNAQKIRESRRNAFTPRADVRIARSLLKFANNISNHNANELMIIIVICTISHNGPFKKTCNVNISTMGCVKKLRRLCVKSWPKKIIRTFYFLEIDIEVIQICSHRRHSQSHLKNPLTKQTTLDATTKRR